MTVFHGSPARAAVALPLLLLLLLLSLSPRRTAVAQDLVVADEDLMKASPLTVAQCRAGCLHKVSTSVQVVYSLDVEPALLRSSCSI